MCWNKKQKSQYRIKSNCIVCICKKSNNLIELL